MKPTDYLVELLGGPGVVRTSQGAGANSVRECVKEGFPYRSLDTLRAHLGLTIPDIVSLLGIPERTLARRREARRLAPDESDRLYRVARVAAYAADVLGAEEKAVAWLRQPNRALGGGRPLDLLDTDAGARQVEDVLGRLAYGVIG